MYSDNRENSYIDENQFMAAANGYEGHTVMRLSDTPRVSTVVFGIICATFAVVCLSCFVFMLFLKPSHTASAIISEGNDEIGNVSDQRAGIALPIYIPELDSRGSRIPVAITGTLKDGSEYSKDTYVSNDGSGLLLEPGSYELRVSGSPISSTGVMYKEPEESIEITVTDDLMSSYSPDGFMSFGVIAAIDITDEQIDAACELVKNDPERTQYADGLAERVRERRDEAVAAYKAAEAAKVEAARVVAEQQLIVNRNQQQQESTSQVTQLTNQDGTESNSSSSNYNGNYSGNSSSGSAGTSETEDGIYEEETTSGSGSSGYSGEDSGSGTDVSEDGGQTSGSGSGSGSGSTDSGSYSGESASAKGGNSSGGGDTGSATVEVGESIGSQTTLVESTE